MTTAIAEYTPTEQALAELRGKYAAVVFDVSNGKGMAEAKAARAELRDYRVALEKKRVEIKAPALERCRLIDTEAKRITAELSALEDPIDETIKAEEQRKEREKAAREQREREAMEARNRRFDEIRGYPLRAISATCDEIAALIAEAEAIDGSEFDPQYQAAAKYEAGLAVLGLRAAMDRRRLEDAKAEQLQRDLAELERLRAEQAETQRKANEAAEAERARQAEADAAKRAAEDAARREADAALAAERKAAADRLAEEAKRVAADRAKLEADKKAAAAKARKDSIERATLESAAIEASALLKENGFGDHVVTLKLDAALAKQIKTEKAA